MEAAAGAGFRNGPRERFFRPAGARGPRRASRGQNGGRAAPGGNAGRPGGARAAGGTSGRGGGPIRAGGRPKPLGGKTLTQMSGTGGASGARRAAGHMGGVDERLRAAAAQHRVLKGPNGQGKRV